jgi:hypothetical protein
MGLQHLQNFTQQIGGFPLLDNDRQQSDRN